MGKDGAIFYFLIPLIAAGTPVSMTCRLPHFRKAQTSHNNASASLGLRLRISMCRRGLHAKGRNPQTGETIQIAASKAVRSSSGASSEASRRWGLRWTHQLIRARPDRAPLASLCARRNKRVSRPYGGRNSPQFRPRRLRRRHEPLSLLPGALRVYVASAVVVLLGAAPPPSRSRTRPPIPRTMHRTYSFARGRANSNECRLKKLGYQRTTAWNHFRNSQKL